MHPKAIFLLKTTYEIEVLYKHPLHNECSEFILNGRLSKVTTEDDIMITKLIETNTKTREIQRAINDEVYPDHKLYVSNIDSMNTAHAQRAWYLYEVMVVAATYLTNNLEIPLIWAEAIHDLRGETLKYFQLHLFGSLMSKLLLCHWYMLNSVKKVFSRKAESVTKKEQLMNHFNNAYADIKVDDSKIEASA
ncbi:hypothetical protein PHYBLDRAFT_143634 [Phycomyces blakesleeanus NRRL 1555(-)]|uniref:Uncharacterized protein n=1 Tax=Phycomyces blakesleeanus (strain ATCC 8743b / DSM 1359 / FGSC 10004 / NBRC 33097 / NRRL 1555) TaxID=763407 RepID=A0A167N950_PHYB8|nr:hypothetical protein PHYBLDRAFT_143634 [Phycomyces blakesleeanus NRRL 1555(-)]OAD75384.1 hypothetical protein PHYBLDRAFT_143634 [Phycomyces blakesleeanus NRRL 1555(-)]|eukprot:XP_018293424.1 hypothetical protein PHYBLDRAFT_143634 [Phycomyces blakesleeanus NRRL 1555(-)]